jgi:Lon protease-like protein
MNDTAPRLPLLVLDDDVCFPGTEMTVRVAEPGGRRLIRDLMDLDADERWLGIVLPRPDGSADPLGRPEVFPGGTAVRLIQAHQQPEGFSDVRLAGEFRFEIERELPGGELYRQAVIRPLGEVELEEDDPGVLTVRRRLLDLVEGLLPELGEQLELSDDDLAELRGATPFLLLVNRLAAGLDVPAARKLELLLANLPERGETVLSILESRRYVLDRLRPWRHLAANPELN